ncbi:AAA family ATPase [Mesorhizobium sp. B2-3-3]|nr:AAA family ATPase [Mesorhizobium sp. B2-3-3]
MEQKLTTRRKGIPDGIKTMPQMLAYMGIVRACRHVPALVARRPVVLGLVVPAGQSGLYGYVAGVVVDKKRWSLGADAEVVIIDPEAKKRTRSEYEVTESLRNHDRIVVVAEDRDHLPTRFAVAADAIVDVPAVSGRDVAAGAKILFGVSVPEPEAGFVAAAGLDAIAGAFRGGRPLSSSLRLIRAAIAVDDTTKVSSVSGPTLDDLHGLGEAGDWGRELAVDLADWRAGRIPWSDVERGILLSGPPGTGKTTYAAALARTCGVDVVLTSHARWQAAGHMGDTLKAMRKSFDEAKAKAPCILFVDEVDSIGDRDTMTGDWANYGREIVNAFLDCLDGAEAREGVVVVGACNAPRLLDAAAKRPGRLDRHVVIPLPDAPARIGILRWHLAGSLVDDDLSHVAERTDGWSGAALEQLVRQARRTARRGRRDMRLGDLAEALPALIPVPPATLWRTAVHEAGHAVVGLAVGPWRVVTASVVRAMADTGGQQRAGGVLWEEDGAFTSSADDYRVRIQRIFGGLAAEEVVFGDRTDGGGGIVGSDLYNATLAAAAMEASMGLGGGLTFLSSIEPGELLRLVQFDHLTRSRVEKTLADCYAPAKAIVMERRADVERLAHALRDRGMLSGEEVGEVLDAQPWLKLVPHAS